MKKKYLILVGLLIILLFISILLLMNKKDNYKLYQASEIGNVGKVEQLIKDGYDVNFHCVKQCEGWTPLMITSANGYAQVVKTLLENGANPNVQNNLGRTALQYAVRYEFIDIIEDLLKSGANPNLKDFTPDNEESVNSAMADALTQKQDVIILKLLIQYGGDVNYNYWDFTPLINASLNNDEELVKILLDKGADVNHQKNNLYPDDYTTNLNIKKMIKERRNNL